VVFAEPFTGFGNLVIVDHGGQAFTMYGTLSALAVSAGSHVILGQHVGEAGSSPDGVASIYFELRVDGRPVDPIQWLRKK
jgi:septal ring factor EnvC (AmiA/AmiB activator)